VATTAQTIVQLSDRRVDLIRQQVLHADGRTVALTTREAQLLRYLVERSGDDVSRDELLEEVWEYKANYATRAVDVAMRRLRSKVEPTPRQPVHLIAVHGVGYRFVPPAEEPPRFATPAPPPARTTNLRPERSTFVGRQAELSRVGERLSSGSRLITILGPGGVGKTRLAHAAARLALQACDAVWVVDLTDARDTAGLLAAVGKTLSIPLTQRGDDAKLVDDVGQALASRGRLLLVFDNFEHLVDHARNAVARWMELAPRASLLVTSRERLRVRGEDVLPLEPLALDEARELFVDRARAAGADLGRADHPAIDRVIERLDRLPLAIELAATRARVLSLEQLEDRLSRRFKLLSGTQGVLPSRQSALRNAIDWSWDLLDEHERSALAQCSVFVGGFSLEAAEEVLEVPDDAPWTLDLVEALRDKSLLRVYEPDELPGELRFGMYESIREYAREKLEAMGGLERARERHANWMLLYAAGLAARVDGPGGLANFLMLAVETDNLLAVERRRAEADPRQALEAVLCLAPVLSVRGPTSRYRRLLDRALQRARALDDAPSRARLHLDRATLLRIGGQLDEARLDIGETLTIMRESSSPVEVDALSRLAMINSDQSRFDESEVITQTALHMARDLRLHRLTGVLLSQLASCAQVRGRVEQAEALALEAVAKQLEVGDERGLASTYSNLGALYAEAGRLEEAEEHIQRALRLHRTWGDRRGQATSLVHLGSLQVRRGRLREASATIDEAHRIYREVGYARFGALSQLNGATVRWALGERDTAEPAIRDAIAVFRRSGDPLLEAMAMTYLAALLASRGDLDEAEGTLEACDERMHGMHTRQAAGVRLVADGFVQMARARAQPDHAEAAAWRESAERIARDGSSSSVLGIQFMARLLQQELQR
jgi:predicted ATPase/DNA-binding winged helix-turn-helix (wHTH) protein